MILYQVLIIYSLIILSFTEVNVHKRIKRQSDFNLDNRYNFDQFGQQNVQFNGFPQNQFGFNNGSQGFGNQQQQQQQQPTTGRPNPSRAFLACMDNCRALSQYNPICGTDGQTYRNVQRLQCAVDCGANVQQATIGACPSLSSTG